ncbi:MAG TPA: Fe-S cluster assembly protein SufD [Halothiobacillus sp.]|nr:Fe-S cluster assembly protein SufD [Halothiobacillus sp.]
MSAPMPRPLEPIVLPDWLRAALSQPATARVAPSSRQAAALAQILNWGLPTARDEEWRWTNLRPIARLAAAEPQAKAPCSDLSAGIPDALVIRFVGGQLQALPQNLPAGLSLTPLSRAHDIDRAAAFAPNAQSRNDALLALNTACATEGVVLDIAANADIQAPVVLDWQDNNQHSNHSHTRLFIRMGAHSSATVLEATQAPENTPHWRNAVSVIEQGANSQLTHISLGLDGDQRLLTDRSFVQLGHDARYRSINIQLGGQLARREIDVNISESGAHCDLLGLMMPRGKQVMDTHTRITHGAPHTTSNEQYQIIADEAGRGIFKGRILVAEDAQKIEAYQNSRNLLLSNTAEIDTKPELEIYADDVKCSHGATIGRLDDEALYYLQSRGISRSNARKLLITGFAQEIIDALPYPELVAQMSALLQTHMGDAP